MFYVNENDVTFFRELNRRKIKKLNGRYYDAVSGRFAWDYGTYIDYWKCSNLCQLTNSGV